MLQLGRKIRYGRTVALTGAVLLMAFLAVRGHRLVERRVFFGDDMSRLEVCRSIPMIAFYRQAWCLNRLLRDSVEMVRLAAVTAYERSTATPELDQRLTQLLFDDNEHADVRTKAGLVLLKRGEDAASLVGYIANLSVNSEFRRRCPALVAAGIEYHLPSMTMEEKEHVLSQALDVADPAREYIATVVRDHVSSFGCLREQLILKLGKELSFEARHLVLSCLSAMEGGIRGSSAEDWEQTDHELASESSWQAVEAEWAAEVRPNYLITEKDGVRCLALPEGAGGLLSWLKAEQGSVDIAEARLSLFAPLEGEYAVWARVYFKDKCGNSFTLLLDGSLYSNFDDRTDVLKRWHWLQLKHENTHNGLVRLPAGFQHVRLRALEDGVYIDKLALLPPGKLPDTLPSPPSVRWDPSLLTSISFASEYQTQAPGTVQTIVVWLRRQSDALRHGTLLVSVGEPFELLTPNPARIEYAEGNPLARTSFQVRLSANVLANEDFLHACYTDDNGGLIEGQMILGVHYDWLSSGPLSPDAPLCAALNAITLPDDQALAGWHRYPLSGYDRFRRLDLEGAYGQLEDKVIFLCTDIEVTKDGIYQAFLTVDDTARVFIDGDLVIEQPRGGPAEGRMVTESLRLLQGRHRLFVRITQAAFPDPTGPDADRHSQNHCVFKLLIRQERHRPAPSVRGLPMRCVPREDVDVITTRPSAASELPL